MEETHESKIEAVQPVLAEGQAAQDVQTLNERVSAVLEVLEENVWSKLPEGVRGKRIEKAEFDAIFE